MSDTQLFQQQYQSAAARIERALVSLDGLIAPTFPKNDNFRNEIQRFTIHGGKRFRPALSLIVAETFGCNDVMPHLALEVFHKYLLAHDDIIDKDDKRYGSLTIHAKMARQHANDAHYGNSLAIIGGDLLASAMHAVILQSEFPAEIKLKLQALVVHAVNEVAWGWYDQFLMDYMLLDSPDLSLKRIEASTVWVTGRYSIKLPLLFGYTIADKMVPEGLEELADILGIMYQMGDDIIGLFGQEDVTGKSNMGDIVQGKKTLPMYMAYSQASAGDKRTLVSLVGKKDLTQEDAAEVKAILRRSGVQEKTELFMKNYADQALSLLDAIAVPADLARFLRGFIKYIMAREA